MAGTLTQTGQVAPQSQEGAGFLSQVTGSLSKGVTSLVDAFTDIGVQELTTRAETQGLFFDRPAAEIQTTVTTETVPATSGTLFGGIDVTTVALLAAAVMALIVFTR